MKLKAWQILLIALGIIFIVILLITAFQVKITTGQIFFAGILILVMLGIGYLIYWWSTDKKGYSNIDRKEIKKRTVEHWLREHSIDVRSTGDPNNLKYDLLIDTVRPSGELKWFSKMMYRDANLGLVCLLLYFDNKGRFEGEKMLCEEYATLDMELIRNPEIIYNRRPDRTEAVKNIKEKVLEKKLDDNSIDSEDLKDLEK